MTKTRPAKHKDKNVFKFQTFSERLANVSVDVIHNLQAARGDVPEDNETWFEETLDKWADMCLSEGFSKLVKDIGTKGSTLVELLLHKDELVQLLLQHLEIRNPAYLQPLLELVVALAKDLKREFQDYFPKFFEMIITNLNTRDTEQLEWSFTCLAYMYKALVKFLVQNIRTTYKLQRFLLDSNQPEHVRVFAAESFALLGRKVLDKKGFVEILFSDISNNTERVEGVGQLLFEIIRGVKNQLHSCSEIYLKIFFSSLSRKDLGCESVKQALSYMIEGLTKYLDAKGAQPLITSLFEHARESKGNPEYSEGLLQLIHQVVTYQNGVLVSDVVQVVKLVGEFLDGEVAATENGISCVVDIAATLIMSSRLKMQMEHTSTLIKLVYASSVIPAEAMAAFTHQLTSFHLFESHVLPHFLTYCHKRIVTDDVNFDSVLENVSKLIHTKRPLPQDRSQVEEWKPYPLEFTFAIKKFSNGKSSQKSFPELCMKILEDSVLTSVQENPEKFLLIVYILPYLRPLNIEKCKQSLRHLFDVILQHLDATFVSNVSQKVTVKRRKSTVEQEEIKVTPPMDKSIEKLCLLLSVTASSLAVMQSVDVNVALVQSVCFRNQMTRSNISLLRVLGLVLAGSELAEESLKVFYDELKDNLSSPYHQVRLLTLHILSSFSPPLPTAPEDTHHESIFKLCLAAEEIELTVQSQREKQKYLQKLDAEHIHFSLPLGGDYDTVPVLYLVSQLFANYKPMWDPVIKLLMTHAHADYFWDSFMKHLRIITEISKTEEREVDTAVFEENGVVAELMTAWVEKETRIDYKNVRSLLWRAMTFFADVAEKKNREIVPMFFQFLETEYYREDASVAKSQDINKREDGEVPRKKKRTGKEKQITKIKAIKEENHVEPMEVDGVETADVSEVKDDEQQEEVNEETEKKKNVRQRKNLITDKKISRKGAVKLLCSHLSVFAKFTQPRNMYQEEQFRNVLYQFLAHRNDNVQRLALDCLMAYNYKYIVTYKKNLYGLLDDKNFRHEIVLFNIDSESDIVQQEHREGLMPVVMRILYGRMHGKAKVARQAIILRFLGGSSDAEIKTFFDLAFNLFTPYLDGELSQVLDQILASVDLKHVLPLKRLQAALNMIGLIFHKLGNLIQQTLPWLLKLLLVIGGHVVGIMQKRNEVDPVHIDMVKQLRNLFIQRVIDFFVKFEKYAWSSSELNAIYRVAVAPQLGQLPSESFASPTPLLKLIAIWSQNPRYFPLLAKTDHSGYYPVNEMVKILTSGKASGGVSSIVMEAFERLVTLEDFSGKIDEDDEGIQELPVEGTVDLSGVDVSRFQEPPNFGSRLLSLHVTSILGYLQIEVTRSSKGFKKGLSTRDLTVMMRLAEFISDAEQSKKLVDIIIPAINAGYDVRSSDSWGEAKGGAKRLTEEQTEYLLSTLALLMKNVGDSNEYFRVLLPLLGKISSRTCRSSLCNVFAAIGQRDADALKLSNQIAALNSFDPRRMDEADFSRRLDAYKEINAELTGGTASADMVRMVVYNSSFSLKIDDDMSLRDSASFSLQSVAAYLLKIDENEAKSVLASHLIPQVRQLIRSKKEQVRHEAVTILAVLVQKCTDLHPQLKDLSKLTDPDPEMDFFENMRHLQGHRRARALVKVAAKLKEIPRLLHADTLTQYLMPLASVYLFSEVYVKQSHLVDAAIETMNAIAKNLPWFSYDKILRYYLQQLVKRAEYQKQAVRIVVAILDGFHFDLSRSKAAVRIAVDQPAVETEEEARPEEVEDLVEVVEPKEEVQGATEESTSDDTLTHTVVPAETTASKIHDTIMRTILPQLHRLLTARSKRDSQHKVNRGQDYYPEDEEILRVPLALAMVALLKGLPKGTLERNLPGIFMKICTFLKSRADSIRETSRDTVVKIMTFLGPAHLYTLVRESSAILKRGFQVHVLIYTLHAVLHNILPQVKVGDLDGVLPRLVELCIQELFGDTSEEKEVAQIVAKVKEAKGHKSYDLLNMMAKFVSQKRLMPLVTPFKDVLITTKSHKVIRKIEDCYYHIATGLAANEGITLQSELIFIHGIVTESIPQWFPKETEVKDVRPTVEKPDSFLIQPEPKRKSAAVTGKENAKTGMKTHSHIMIEFALQLLHLRLKKETVEAEDKTLLGMLDPFVSILADSLASPHNKQIGLALRCLTKLLCLPLPSVEKNIKRICGSVFTVLNKYAGPGSAQGDQYEMVVSAYKLITVIIRDVSSMKLENDQLRVLLTYAEQSLSDVDGNSQATGFAVLKAILGRRLEFPELPDVMQRIAKLAIISEISHVRSQCRQLFLQYLIDYPLGKKVIRQIQFFLGQLEYDREDGRLSALEFLDSAFGTFPKSFLNSNAPLLFVTLSPRLVNEDSKTCLKMVARVLGKLLENLEDSMRNELFQIVLLWLQDENVSHRIISAQLTEVFVEVEGTRFESRLKEFLPLLETNLCDETDGDMQKEKLLIRLLITISKIFTTSPVIIRNSVAVAIWREIQKHLLHQQITIRLLCARLIGVLFAAFTPDEIAQYVNTKRKPKNMEVFENPVEVLRTLALDCSDQLSPLSVEAEIAEQAIKNLLFLFKIATRTEGGNENADVNEDEESIDQKKKLFGVRWYMKRIRKEINSEIAENPNCGVKRTAAFQFYAAALLDLHQTAGAAAVTEHLSTILPPIIREISISEDKLIPELSELATLARETAEFLKQLVGHEVYMEFLAACRKTMNKKKIVRKAEKSQRAVTNPGLAAKLKMKKQASKRDAKKKKIAALKGKVVKKKKLKNVAVLEE